MDELLDIAEVARRTGLTARTLRYYEGCGLLDPVRSHNGRRLYGPEALERINQIVTLKRAGLTLAQIQALLAESPPDLIRVIGARIAALVVRQAEVAQALKSLMAVDARLAQGQPLNVATLCDLIRQGARETESEGWKRDMVVRLFGEEKVRQGAERMAAVLTRIDPAEYRRKSTELIARIETAMPLDPDSAEAEALYAEWQALFAPFMAIGRSEPLPPSGTSLEETLDGIERWKQAGQAPQSGRAFEFLFMMGRRRVSPSTSG